MEHQITIKQPKVYKIKTVIYIPQNYINIQGVANTVCLIKPLSMAKSIQF